MRLKITFTSSYLTVTQRATRIYRVSPFGVPAGIPEGTFTAEGQIIVGLGSGTYAVLSAPSASGLRLVSDLLVSGKIKWAAGGDVELLSLTNKSGGDLDLGAVVVQDTGNDSALDTTTTEGADVIGVLAEGILNDASGNVSQIGAQTVLVQGNVSRGDYLISSTTAGRAKSNGADPTGAFGVALTAYAGGGAGSVTAALLGRLDLSNFTYKNPTASGQTLTDAANISWNLNNGSVATVTLAGSRTLDNPTNMKTWGTYILRVIQDATGSRTLAYGAAYKWPSGTAPTLSVGANDVDILTFVSDGTNMYGVIQKDFS